MACAAIVAGASVIGSAALAAPGGVKVGVLTCNVEPGWSYVIGSTRPLECSYAPKHGRGEHYVGKVQKVGVDVGYVDGATIVWAVVAPTSDIRPGSLEGDYGGASASIAVGVGGGANVLVGGFDKSITLQPISLEGQTGVNLAAGISAITLEHAR
ncbi:MAG: DUF992 domain-containing protein [Alphaproteobacteria bacterium]|nr:DUF992 domain-containing protein [Alphaproteobacteria bacterium]